MVAAIRMPNNRPMRPRPCSGLTTHSMASNPGPMVRGEPNATSAANAKPASEAPPMRTRETNESVLDCVLAHRTSHAMERPPRPAKIPSRRAPNTSPTSTAVNSEARSAASNQTTSVSDRMASCFTFRPMRFSGSFRNGMTAS